MRAFAHRLSTTKLPEALRAGLLLAVYSTVLVMSLWISYELRFEFAVSAQESALFVRAAIWMIPLALAALWLLGQFRSLLSYFSVPDMVRIAESQIAVCAVAYIVWYASRGAEPPPRSVIFINLIGATAGLGMFRLGLRLTRERYHQTGGGAEARVRRIAIIGATDTGAHLIKEMKHRPDLRMQPVAIFDEDPKQWGRQIHGVPILGSHQLLLSPKSALNLAEVVIADTAMSNVSLRKIVHQLAEIGLKCKVAPSTDLLRSGESYRTHIRPIEIEDLLGREEVDLQTDQIRDLIRDRCVAISGAGGSIGSELCRHILGYGPRKIVLIEQCETQLFAIEQELLQAKSGATHLISCVADILNEMRIHSIFRKHAPEIVFHAAAHKHVPMMEDQPAEAFQNNVIGTMRLADAAMKAGSERFVLISSDKAINPTNVMGATKRLAEIYLQALHARNTSKTKFMAVRFGNVLGSSGSVIPTFKRQIAEGGPLTLTHPEVTRYFMITKEAIGLVLQSATLGEGGEIFVLDMGTPVKIADLARQLIELSGLRPDIDIEIKLTGLRPGEKLFEELNHTTENMAATGHSKIMRFIGPPQQLESVSFRLQELYTRSHTLTDIEMKMEIQKLVPEYKPYIGINSEDANPHLKAGDTAFSSRHKSASENVGMPWRI